MSQTSVPAAGMPIGVAGEKYDSGPHDIVSGFNEEGTSQMPWGIGLMAGPSEKGFLIPSGASGTFEVKGINVFSHAHSRAGNADPDGRYSGDLGATGLLPDAGLQVGREGRFLVPVAIDVRKGDRPFVYVVPTGTFGRGVWVGSNMGGSYVRDCTAQGEFVTGTFTAADGTTKVAVLDCNFKAKPA